MKLGELLKSYRTEHKLSMDAFCELSDLTKGYISMLEKNEHPKSKKPIVPSYDTIEKIAKGMQISTDDLINMLDDEQEIQINATPAILSKSQIQSIYDELEQPRQEKVLDFAKEQLEEQENSEVVSIFNKPQDDENYITDYVEGLVAAGHGTFQEDNLHMEVRLRADDVPESYDTIAKVAGDSMEPLIEDNDLLFINITSQVDINDIGIFQINGKNFVKKLKRDYNGSWYLQSLNSGYEEIRLTENDDIRTIGQVVDIYKV